MKKTLLGIMVFALAISFSGKAQAATTNDLLQQLQALMAKVQALQAQFQSQTSASQSPQNVSAVSPSSVQSQTGATGSVTLSELPGNVTVSCRLPVGLTVGAQGNAVYLLQSALDKGGYYPEGLVTGYYGPLTAAAVARYKDANSGGDLNALVANIYSSQCNTGGPVPPVSSTALSAPILTYYRHYTPTGAGGVQINIDYQCGSSYNVYRSIDNISWIPVASNVYFKPNSAGSCNPGLVDSSLPSGEAILYYKYALLNSNYTPIQWSTVNSISTHEPISVVSSSTQLSVSLDASSPESTGMGNNGILGAAIGTKGVTIAIYDVAAQNSSVALTQAMIHDTMRGLGGTSDFVNYRLMEGGSVVATAVEDSSGNLAFNLYFSGLTISASTTKVLKLVADVNEFPYAQAGGTHQFAVTSIGFTGPQGAQTQTVSNVVGGIFTISGTETNQSPVISGVSGPTSLTVNQTGTWGVQASDPNNGNLSYSVNWGDQPSAIYPGATAQSVSQTATLTHSYGVAGTYTVKFTVTNSAGATAQTSITVNVGNTTTFPPITVLSPNGGETWNIGETHAISWKTENLQNSDKVWISLIVPSQTMAGGTFATVITQIASGVSNSGSYSWTIPGIIPGGNNYKIMITTEGNEEIGKSDNYFTIQSPLSPITVTNPQAGSILSNSGNNVITNIQWAEKGVTASGHPISIVLYDAKGSTVVKYIADGLPDTGTYAWNYDPSIPNGSYQIVVDYGDVKGVISNTAGNSGVFTISSPQSCGAYGCVSSSTVYTTVSKPIFTPNGLPVCGDAVSVNEYCKENSYTGGNLGSAYSGGTCMKWTGSTWVSSQATLTAAQCYRTTVSVAPTSSGNAPQLQASLLASMQQALSTIATKLLEIGSSLH